jgi:hypothetical protein
MNIHILPTDKPSRLFKDNFNTLFFSINIDQEQNHFKPKHIYITSDEFIEEGDFGLNLSTKNIVQDDGIKGLDSYFKKIILTTDQSLDGVQAIDDEFLEWYVQNPSCERVDVEKENICARCHSNDVDECWSAKECSDGRYDKKRYKIIIPKEEPKQENCCTPIGQIKRYMNCVGCDRKPQQETLEQSYQRGYERGLNALIPLIENLNKEITELKRKGI